MSEKLRPKWIEVDGKLIQGHQVASGQAENSPFERGTIEMQLPHFKEAGIELGKVFLGTLNVSIAPKCFAITSPSITVKDVKWSNEHPAETFSLSPCFIVIHDKRYKAYVYYPHPETKIGHFKDNTVLEVLSEYIDDAQYGLALSLELNENEITVS